MLILNPHHSEKPKSFMLQVASYKDQADAENAAKLLLIGLTPKVDKTNSGWYRVDLGPYTSVRAADVVRHKIQKQKLVLWSVR